MFSFTIQGKQYNSELNGNRVAEYLRENFKSEFVVSMLQARERYGRWTERQAMWCHKMVIDDMEKKQQQCKPVDTADATVITLPNVAEFLSRPVKLKRIKLTFQHNDGEVSIRVARDGQRFWIAKNGQLVGSLKKTGELVNKGLTPDVLALLDNLEEDAQATVAEHGKASGACCFCSLPLTDERSTAVGYGKVCAGHYGLKWGE